MRPSRLLAVAAGGLVGVLAAVTVAAGAIHLTTGAVALTAAHRSLWVSGFGSVSRLNADSGRVLARIGTPGTDEFSQIAHGSRDVWVTAPSRQAVYRIDPRTNRVIATIHITGPVRGIAVGAGRVWVTTPRQGNGRLFAFDPHTDRRRFASDPDRGRSCTAWATCGC